MGLAVVRTQQFLLELLWRHLVAPLSHGWNLLDTVPNDEVGLCK
jgi:hypothetical protein